ncbi:PilZ domain-containing protein [Stappia sp. ES.058]|uniref:PilZ domain-containing protein n=1 Tax=Stappia sp. ES.058 TaxID=1881061 RepID=UPI00087B6D71|nr:PilZ domain-containing protein [Stappia sp. ES.058]SDT97814.1 PilZ domain-containing protein [Stappia sp. ES.058]
MANLASRSSGTRRSEAIVDERRSTPRAQGSTQVMVITMRGPISARMLDVSLTGCRIRCPDLPKFAISARIAILAYGLELLAEQRWRNGAHSGWRFVYNAAEQDRLKTLLRRDVSGIMLNERMSRSFRKSPH